MRIGVNWGSLDQDLLAQLMDENAARPEPKDAAGVMREALVESGLRSAALAEEIGLGRDKIVISAKVSQVQDLIAVYGELGARSDYALHLGLTEAGMGSKGIVASTAALSVLLQQGIGDTIRISLTPEPGGDRTQEVIVAQEILQTMGFRSFVPLVAACPGCGRTTSTVFQELAERIQDYVRRQMPVWRETYEGVESMQLAVMGCIVNGPGESKHADIGISLPGTGEAPAAPVFIDGKKAMTLRGTRIAEEFQEIVSRITWRVGIRDVTVRVTRVRRTGQGITPRSAQRRRRLAHPQPLYPETLPEASVDAAVLRPARRSAPSRTGENRAQPARHRLTGCWRSPGSCSPWSCSAVSRASTMPDSRSWTGAPWWACFRRSARRRGGRSSPTTSASPNTRRSTGG